MYFLKVLNTVGGLVEKIIWFFVLKGKYFVFATKIAILMYNAVKKV